MNKEEIEEYLKRIDELGNKLTGKDKETYAWLIHGFNQYAKWLNEAEQQCKKQKEVIDRLENKIKLVKQYDFDKVGRYELLSILDDKEV